MTKNKTNNKNYRQMRDMNNNKMNDAYNLFIKHSGLDIPLNDLLEVIDLAYEKNEDEKQLNTVLRFFDIEATFKNEFALKSIIKYNGLSKWCNNKITVDDD